MAQRPNNVIVKKDLTSYAFALSQELDPMRQLATTLAPIVPTGATDGRYNSFDTTQAFKNYINPRRSIGGNAGSIEFLNDTDTFSADPFGLRISIDEQERKRAGEAGMSLLEQAKTRTLTVNCWLSYLYDVVAKAKAAVSAMAGKGSWLDPAVDPILELNQAVKAIFLATGVVPNNIVIDFGAWCVLADHPKVVARMPGADLAIVSPDRVQKMLVNPNIKISIVETSILTGGGLGNSSATKAGILGGSALVFFNSPVATQYDCSFMKTFSPSATLFTEVYTYRQEPHLDWYENNWVADTKVVSSLLAKRIDVAGAST